MWSQAPAPARALLLGFLLAFLNSGLLARGQLLGGNRGVVKKASGSPKPTPSPKPAAATEAPQLIVAKASEAQDKPYQACESIDDHPGHCRHIRYCLINEFRTNYTLVSLYGCTIEEKYVGVCCPDDRDSRPKSLPKKVSSSDEDGEGRVVSGTPKRVDAPQPVRRPSPLGPPGKNRGCGVSAVLGVQPVQSGGGVTDPGEYPWMAAVLSAKENEQFCGGVVLDQTHVLTAAHCLIRRKQADLRVVLGEYDLYKPDETRSQTFKVVQIRRHEKFDMHTYENDIAIFTLDRPAVFNTYVWPVCFPDAADLQNIVNKTAIVIGWGAMSYGGPVSTVLMEVAVPVWNNKQCQTRFTQPILDTAICAGGYGGGKDSCQGDSGGPMMIQKADGRWTNIGIVSFGIRCGEPMQPGVYTRVTEYLDWIQKNT